jgi:hypothetical protein
MRWLRQHPLCAAACGAVHVTQATELPQIVLQKDGGNTSGNMFRLSTASATISVPSQVGQRSLRKSTD